MYMKSALLAAGSRIGCVRCTAGGQILGGVSGSGQCLSWLDLNTASTRQTRLPATRNILVAG